MVVDNIRNADSEEIIYSLLTAYLEHWRCRDKATALQGNLTDLPVRDTADLTRRFEELIGALDAASRQLNGEACVQIREALYVFGATLNRLKTLQRKGNYGVPVSERARAVAAADAQNIDCA